MNNSFSQKSGAFLPCLILVAIILLPIAALAQTQDYWVGTTGDFNVATNWSLNVVPASGYTANNDTSSNNIVQINAGDPTWTLNGIRAGVSNSGSFVQNGSTITLGSTQNGWLRMGVTTAGSIGYYTIASNAILNTSFGVTVGEVGSGVLNINGGTINVGTEFIVNDNGSAGSSGTVNQTAGTVNCNTQTWIGQGAGGQNGVFNMSGGFFGCTNWFVLGRSGGKGTMIMTGGTLNAGGSGGFFDVGTGFQGAGNGTLTQSGGTINIVGNGQFVVPETSPGTGTYNLSGTGTLNCNNWLAIGRGGVGIMNISGGTIAKTDTGNDHIDIGAGGSSSGSGTGTINQTGGTITNTTTDFWLGEVANGTWNMSGGTNYLGNLIICEGTGIASSMNLNGGFLSVGTISSAQPVASSATLNLNGGAIQASGSTTSFINNLTSASMQSGGVTIDTQGFTVTIPQALTDGGGGGLIKLGSGSLTLSGANTYTGSTIVSNGTLFTTTASTGGGNYIISDGAVLSLTDASSSASLAASAVTLGVTTGASLNFDLSAFTGNPSVAPIAVSGPLTVNGGSSINIVAGSPAVGAFPLITYGSYPGSGTLTLNTLPPGVQATLSNNVAGGTLYLVVSGAAAPRWNGTVPGGVWDIGTTTNWLDINTLQPIVYNNGSPVLFDDNATGTTTVNLTTAVRPGSVTINNSSLPYTLTGAGSINGTTGLVKNGTNIFTIADGGNGYTGSTLLEGGVLSVSNLANGGSASAIGASSASPANLVFAGGTLSYTGPTVSINRGYNNLDTSNAVDIDAEGNLSLGGPVTAGAGSGFTKGGPAQLAYTAAGTNVLSDSLGYIVAQGPVLLSGTGSGQVDNIVGTLYVGNAGSTNAALNIATNTTLNIVSSGNLHVGDGSGLAGSASLNQSGGTVTVNSAQTWVGQGSNGVGALTVSGGTFNVNNWLAIGRANGTGAMSVSGNAQVNISSAGAFDIGTSAGINGDTGTGTLTQTGGVISNNCPTWLGEGASGEPAQGTWNMSGGTAFLLGTQGQGSPSALFVGQSGIGTNTLSVSGTGAITCGNYVSLGHLSGVIGILNIGNASQPGGSLTMTGGQDFNVGDSGSGILNMVANGGGHLTVPGTMYLTRGSTASGTVNLNGGTLSVSFINNGYGFGNNLTNNPQVFNFNGGTLKALTSSLFFIQPYVTAVVQSGGAIIDDGGFTIAIDANLADGGGGGGLTKLGAGALFLNGTNTYTGTTSVSAGALGIGPTGGIAGPVTVASSAILLGDTGTIDTCFINNTLTLSNGSTTIMRLTPSSNDQIAGLTGVTYGGALVVTNSSATPLTAGAVYKLFNSAVAGNNNFSSVTLLPIGSATFNPAAGTLTINSVAPPMMNSPTLSGGNLVITGSGGTAGGGYTLLSSTSVATPLTNWVTNTTGTFSGTGTFSNSIPTTNGPKMFFKLRTP
jgi:fibronectin-binding autotransporter adhesin